ncbi:phosphate transport system substrate-binding protein [Elusimicrobium posterum]|uniref:phosphate ABC transporter substrate-binding protein n=1 Tax=Elusimicrobium posterum TaxID=3116653 RepID=UPI003C796532
MKKYILTLTAFLVTTLSYAGITLEGSTTVLPLAQKAAEVYMDANPKADISIRGGGSGVGINSLIVGTVDIANSSREIKSAEIEKAKEKNIYPQENIVAMDAIALVINPSNKVSNLTKQQVKDIFTGKIKNWKEVGGDNKKIVVVSRDSASGTFEAFNELALDKEKVRKDALMQASNQGVAAIISTTPGAIGYVGLGYITSKTKALSIDSVQPSVETVLAGKYAYSRPLYMYTNGSPKGETKALLDFINSAGGQKIAKELGFVPLK